MFGPFVLAHVEISVMGRGGGVNLFRRAAGIAGQRRICLHGICGT
jgi:hypothetical protein